MGRIIIFLVFAFFGYSQSATIKITEGYVRSPQEIRDYDDFLKRTMNGSLSDSTNSQNVEERSGGFEGDIILTESQRKALVDDFLGLKNAVRNTKKLWPNRVVIYEINATQFTPEQISAIHEAIADIEKNSCVTFRERKNEDAFIYITGAPEGCSSNVGYNGKRQHLNLAPSIPGSGCFIHGKIIHEFLHSLGFWHMQSTYNRDDWVKILWENIISDEKYNFEKHSFDDVTNLGEKYDYGSVMHYSEYGFSRNGNKTIEPIRDTHGIEIGQRIGMSTIDIRKLNKLYQCPGY